MIRLAWVIAAGLTVSQARAEAEHVVIGPEQLWIEAVDQLEVVWVGKNETRRVKVLSGHDVEIVGLVTGADAVMLGGRAVVAVMPASHSCETLKEPLAYYVIALDPVPGTHGPMTACGELTMALTEGAILLEEDPMRADTEAGGQSALWAPGRGFVDRLE